MLLEWVRRKDPARCNSRTICSPIRRSSTRESRRRRRVEFMVWRACHERAAVSVLIVEDDAADTFSAERPTAPAAARFVSTGRRSCPPHLNGWRAVVSTSSCST